MKWGRLENLTANAEDANAAIQRMSNAVTVAAIVVAVAVVLMALSSIRKGS